MTEVSGAPSCSHARTQSASPASRGSSPRTPGSSASGNRSPHLVCEYNLLIQMSYLSGANPHPHWRGDGLPALLPRQPVDRPDGQAEEGGHPQLLSPQQPGDKIQQSYYYTFTSQSSSSREIGKGQNFKLCSLVLFNIFLLLLPR